MLGNNKTLTKAETETLRQFEDWLNDLKKRKGLVIMQQREIEHRKAIEHQNQNINICLGFYIFLLLFAVVAIYLSLNRSANYAVTRWIERCFGAIGKSFPWISQLWTNILGFGSALAHIIIFLVCGFSVVGLLAMLFLH